MRGERLQIEYNDINDVKTLIRVWQTDYSGPVSLLYGTENPLEITWGDGGAIDFQTLYGSTATVRFYAIEELQFEDLFSPDIYKNEVRIYKGPGAGTLIWQGFISPEKWAEERVQDGDEIPVMFVATDMLSMLKELPFADDKGAPLTGYRTNKEVLDRAIIAIGVDLPLYYAVDLVNLQGVPWMDVMFDNGVYAPGTTFAEVLNDLLFGMRFFQRNGVWNLITYNQLTQASITRKVEGGADVVTNNLRDTYWFENRVNIEILPGIKEYTYKVDQARVENMLINGDFANSSVWVPNGGVTLDRPLYDDNKRLALLTNGNEVPADPVDMTKYIRQQISGVDSGVQSIRIKFDYGATGYGDTETLMYAMIYIEENVTTRYATYVIDDNEITLGWTTVPTVLRLGARPNGSSITYENPKAVPLQEIGSKFKTFDFFTENIPQDGLVMIRLYGCYSSSAFVYKAAYANVEINLYSGLFNDYGPHEIEETIVTDAQARYTPQDVDFRVNDVPDVPNPAYVYRCGMYNLNPIFSGGVRVHTWQLSGIAYTASYAKLRTVLMSSLQRFSRLNYQLTLADVIIDLQCLIDDEAATEVAETIKRLLENGVTYNDRMNTIDGQYTEVIQFDQTPYL